MDRKLIQCFSLQLVSLLIYLMVIAVNTATGRQGSSNYGYALPRPDTEIGCANNWMDMAVRIKGYMLLHRTTISPEFSLALRVTQDNHTAFLHFCVYNGTKIPQQTIGEGTSFTYTASKPWPLGEYCIYSMGSVYVKGGKLQWDHGTCPEGLTPGFSTYPFKTDIKENNKISPFSISAVHHNHTRIQYCCSTRGNRNKSIDLPLAIPFYLFPYGNKVCQKVRNMNVRLEFISWPDMNVLEDGTHPYTDGGSKVFYCYYVPKGSGYERTIRIATYGIMLGTPLLTLSIALSFRFRQRWQLRKYRHRRMSAATVDQHSTIKCTDTHGSVMAGTSKSLNLYTSLPS